LEKRGIRRGGPKVRKKGGDKGSKKGELMQTSKRKKKGGRKTSIPSQSGKRQVKYIFLKS